MMTLMSWPMPAVITNVKNSWFVQIEFMMTSFLLLPIFNQKPF